MGTSDGGRSRGGDGATDRTADPVAARLAAHQTLARALSTVRRGVHADRTARALLARESDGREVVGVTDDGDRALVYVPAARTLVAVGVDRHGTGALEATLARDLDDPGAWVDVYGDDLAWVHPRYE
jgi:hypothetical protein